MLKLLLLLATSFTAFFAALSSDYICCLSIANSTCYEQGLRCLGDDHVVQGCCCHNTCPPGGGCCCSTNSGCLAEQKLNWVPMPLPEGAVRVVKGELVNATALGVGDEL